MRWLLLTLLDDIYLRVVTNGTSEPVTDAKKKLTVTKGTEG